jgi:hypothetical protein
MFDDEDLPSWLVEAGITFAGRRARGGVSADAPPWALPQRGLPDLPAPLPALEDAPPPWAAAADSLSAAMAADVPLEEVPPGFQTEQPDWLLPAIEGAEAPLAAFELPDTPMPWDADAPAALGTPPDDPFSNLDWMAQTPAAADQPASPTFKTSWLGEAAEAATPASPSQQAATPTFKTSWLSEAATSAAPEADSSAWDVDLFADSAPAETPLDSTTTDDWMRDFSVEDALDPDPDPTAENSPTLPTAPDLSWLGDAAMPQAAEPLSAAEPADWLRRDFSVEGDLEAAAPTDADWLSQIDLPSGEESLTAVAAEPEPASDLPDWLSSGKLPDAEPADTMPDWLDSQPILERPTPSPSGVPDLSAADMSDWLSADSAPDLSAELADLAAELPSASEVPDWLQTGYLEPRTDSAPPPAPAPDLSAEAEIPAWMRDLAPAPPTPSALTGSSDTATSGMDWLDQYDFEASTAASTAPELADIPKPSRAAPRSADLEAALEGELDIDALLAETDVPIATDPDLLPVAPINLDEEFDFDTLPDLPPPSEVPLRDLFADDVLAADVLADLPPPTPAAAPVKPSVPSAPSAPVKATTEAAAVSELPEWVAEMRPDSSPTLVIGDQQVTLEERPLSALPEAMLALRERLKQLPSAPAPAESKDSQLSNIAEALQPPSLSITPAPLAPSGALATAAQLAGVQTLRKIAAAQESILKRRMETEASAPPSLRLRARFKLDRLLLTLLLVAAVVLPFFTDLGALVPPPRHADLDAAGQARFAAVSRAVSSVLDGSLVLVAFEYTPTAAGELDDLARVLLRDLLQRGARPVILSTNPSGALHAYHVLHQLSLDPAEMQLLGRSSPLVPRRDYVVLGYLPGGVSGVRALANALYDGSFQQQVIFESDLEGLPSGISAQNIPILHANPVFVLAQSQDDVQIWAEQFHAPASAPANTPLRMVIAAASAATAAVQTYAAADPQRILGTLIGLRDALIYRDWRAQYADAESQRTAERRWQSVGFTALIAALAILFGAAFGMIRILAQRRRAQ